jgi:hypothetical protein
MSPRLMLDLFLNNMCDRLRKYLSLVKHKLSAPPFALQPWKGMLWSSASCVDCSKSPTNRQMARALFGTRLDLDPE